MTNHKLLEIAAKAAGNPQGTRINGTGLLMANDLYWNPLTDDGDALRLAVILKLEVYHGIDLDRWAAYAGYYTGQETRQKFVCEPHGENPCAATRRAIVRAAAAIGEKQ